MTLLAQTSILSALISFSIAISIFLEGRRSPLQSHFSYFNFNITAVMVSLFLLGLVEGMPDTTIGSIGLRMLLITSLGLPVTGLRFFSLFLPDLEKAITRTLNVCYPLTVAFAGFAVTPLYKNPIPLALHSSYILLTFTLCFLFILLRFRTSDNQTERNRLRPVFYGGFITIVLFTLDLLSYSINWPYVFLGNLCLAMYNYYLLQVLTTSRAIDTTDFLGKGIILGVLSFLIAGIYWLLTFWVGTKELGPFFFSVLVASIVILILYEPLKIMVETQAAEYFFRRKRALRIQLEQLRRNLINVIDLERMGRLLMDTLRDSKRVTHASFYLLREDSGGFARINFFGEAPVANVDFASDASFLQHLQDNLNPVVKQDLEFQFTTSSIFSWRQEGGDIREEERLLELIRSMIQMKSEVCLPCISSEQKLLGFINLQDDRIDASYSQEELSFMMMVAAQVAITIENSRLFEKIKERERLAALGEMAAGLAHEIRNPLGAIKGAAQLLNPEHLNDIEEEMIDIILEEVDRLNGVVSQFLDYARPLRVGFEVIDLNHVLKRTIQLVEKEVALQHIEVDLSLDETVKPLAADAEKLKQVFFNLIRNGVESMPKGGTLHISTKLVEDLDPPSVQIIFEDEGIGIPPDVLKNIFIPFYTTKSKGTGLGLSICQRLIEHHHGSIQIQSRLDEGTRFTIRIPLKREGSAS